MKIKEKILHAAVKAENGMIFLGRCHGDAAYQCISTGMKISDKSIDQGFFTNKGRYVDRQEGAVIAKKAKQLDSASKRKVSYLLSEDIWMQSKRYVYTTALGYVEILS